MSVALHPFHPLIIAAAGFALNGTEGALVGAGAGFLLTVFTDWLRAQRTTRRSRFSDIYTAHPVLRAIEPLSYCASAYCANRLSHSSGRGVQSVADGVIALVLLVAGAEAFSMAISLVVATYAAWHHSTSLQLAREHLEFVGDMSAQATKRPRLKRLRHALTPIVVRPDIFGVLASRTFGKISSVPLPRFLRPMVYGAYAWKTGADLDEIGGELDSFRSLQQFFSRPLKPGLRPVHPTADLVSPVDGTVVVMGRVKGDRIEQVKGAPLKSSRSSHAPAVHN